MNITLKINGIEHTIDTAPSTTLLAALRGLGFYGIKFGDEQGLSGADTILLDGKPVNGGSMLAAQAEGHNIVTIEGLGEHPEQGWRKTEGLHPLQKALLSWARSNVDTARPRKFSRQRRCSIRIRIQVKNKSGMLLRECCVAVPVISSQCKLY